MFADSGNPAAPEPEDIALRRLRALAPASPPPGSDEPRAGSGAEPGSGRAPAIPPPPYAVAAGEVPAAAAEPGAGGSGTGGRGRPTAAAAPEEDAPPGYVAVEDDPAPGLLRSLWGRGAGRSGAPRIEGAGFAFALVVCGAAALVTGLVVVLARPDPAAEPLPEIAGAAAEAQTSAAVPQEEPSPQGDVVVHVGGEVEDPGLVTLPPGARVADAVEAAGGVREDAGDEVTDTLNLARHLIDGEQVLVGGEAAPQSGGAGPGGESPVDLNTATAEELQELPGVGPVLAETIVEFRTANGGFASVDQLLEVRGIGEGRFADLQDRVAVAGS